MCDLIKRILHIEQDQEIDIDDFWSDYVAKVLYRQIKDCLSHESFSVGVALSSANKVDRIYSTYAETFSSKYVSKDGLLRILKRSGYFEVDFKNGSRIVFFTATDRARGCKFNRIVVGDNIEKNVVDGVLTPCIRPIIYVDKNTRQYDRESLSWLYY